MRSPKVMLGAVHTIPPVTLTCGLPTTSYEISYTLMSVMTSGGGGSNIETFIGMDVVQLPTMLCILRGRSCGKEVES